MTRRPGVPHVLRRPEQGWSSLLLLLGMLLLLGISIANAREASLVLVPEAASTAGALPLLMMAGGLIGFLLARSHIGVVRAHIIGAATAATLLLLSAGEALLEAGVNAPEGALSERIGVIWVRLEDDIVRYLEGELLTPVVVTYLIFGALCWTTAQFSAFSVFRYGRGGPAVVAIGTVLFLNVGLASFTAEAELLPVLPVLALFSSLAMLLLMRLQLVSQRLQWARRHISDTGEVSRLFLRSGVLFVVLTVVSATSLTAVATVEPQDVSLGGLEEPLKDLGDEIARALGVVGVAPPEQAPLTRGQYTRIDDRWEPTAGTAFTAVIEAGQLRRNYWWGYARDTYTLDRGWTSEPAGTGKIPAGQDLPVPEVSAGGQHPADVLITMAEVGAGTLTAFALAEPSRYQDRAVAVTSDDDRSIGVVEYQEPVDVGEEVRVRSYVRDYSDDATSLTANELRAAGEVDQPWAQQYLAVPEGAVGPSVRAFVKEIEASVAGPHDSPYDKALAVQAALGDMVYREDMSRVCDAYDEGAVPECVISEGKGFCQHYATTMAIVLRELGIPSRFITGYLPGVRDPETGAWTVDGSALHNWVEAYFPGIGWIRFDPTPGREGQTPTAFPEGPELTPSPEPSFDPEDELPTFEPTPVPTPDDGGLVPAPDDGDDPPASLIIGGGLILALLLTVVSVLLLFRLRRLPEGDDSLAYRGIVSLATRLGYGPHPSQTEYEYAGSLSEAVPSVRDELFVVADARVETAYGQRHLDAQRRGSLRRAYARIRTALLRLSLRRRR